jgi:hypothetical protein
MAIRASFVRWILEHPLMYRRDYNRFGGAIWSWRLRALQEYK